MVSISKWAIIGLGVVAASLFFKEAAATSLTGTLSRTGLAGSSLGSGIQSTLTGTGTGLAALLNPLFSGVDLIKKAGSIFGNDNGGGGGMNQDNNSGGGIASNNIPSSLAGVSASNGGSSSSPATTPSQSFSGGYTSKPSYGWGG
tara:strand:- start:1682 stop:2116 length:435 start_codon:yes stop_codon:yes gene_type:complete